MEPRNLTRRNFLAAGAAAVGSIAASASDIPHELGAPRRAYGERSHFEKSSRYFRESATPASGSSRTPLQDLVGIITPSALHYEVHHYGVPDIDPRQHELMIHGLVERPLVFTMEDLYRLPPVSRIHFLECAGNSGGEQIGRPGADPQRSHGLLSCSEWTGVPLRTLLEETGVKPGAKWIVAEGADAGRLARSIPLEKALDDVLVAYGQNGEALRPEQGYPVRLVVPGWEGNVNTKWVGRVKLVEGPLMTAYETAFYTDLMSDGKARQFTFVMEAKSVITRPAGGQRLAGPGFYEITGLAWSGRGRITGVEVSTNGVKGWQKAELNEPVFSKALTRFRLGWWWDGGETTLRSRCTDETGYVQPTREELLAVRGENATDHYNGIKTWRVQTDGRVTHEEE
ncbi:MAG: sulfite dehydrogenase [Candidatus Acidiferrales bacterium]